MLQNIHYSYKIQYYPLVYTENMIFFKTMASGQKRLKNAMADAVSKKPLKSICNLLHIHQQMKLAILSGKTSI